MIILLGTVAVLGFSILAILWRGYVLGIVWGWFAVPILSLPSISVAEAIGLAMVASLLCPTNMPDSDSDKSAGERIFVSVVYTFLAPALVLMIGWIVKQYI